LNPHRVFAQQGAPPWDAEPRFELGPALQQADATELRRIRCLFVKPVWQRLLFLFFNIMMELSSLGGSIYKRSSQPYKILQEKFIQHSHDDQSRILAVVQDCTAYTVFLLLTTVCTT
jgi:hypothetical protein